jgi:uncharacterized protein
VVRRILDAGFLAHVGFQAIQQPFVIPTLYGREGDSLFIHGSSMSRLLGALSQGAAACVVVTLLDGMVLARSAFNHSMNYRSVVAFGLARTITQTDRKLHALRVISDHVLAGRWSDVRGPSARELKATSVLEFSIEEASAKIRHGPPIDEEKDYALPVWAGVIPLWLEARSPIPDSRLAAGVAVPDYALRSWAR